MYRKDLPLYALPLEPKKGTKRKLTGTTHPDQPKAKKGIPTSKTKKTKKGTLTSKKAPPKKLPKPLQPKKQPPPKKVPKKRKRAGSDDEQPHKKSRSDDDIIETHNLPSLRLLTFLGSSGSTYSGRSFLYVSLNLLTSFRQATLTMMDLGSKAARCTPESDRTLDSAT